MHSGDYMNLYSVKVGRGLKLYFERGSRYVVSNNLFHSKNAYLNAVYSEIRSQETNSSCYPAKKQGSSW